MAKWTVSLAVLCEDKTWFTKDVPIDAETQQEAEDQAVEKGRGMSDVGMACVAGAWELEE